MKRAKTSEDNKAYSALLTLLDDGSLKRKVPAPRAVKQKHTDSSEIEGLQADGEDDAEDAEEEEVEDGEIQVEDDNEGDTKDPFEWHFANPDLEGVEQPTAWAREAYPLPILGPKSQLFLPDPAAKMPLPAKVKSMASIKLKYRLLAPFEQYNKEFTALQKEFATPLFGYQDVLIPSRTWANGQQLQNMYTLHAMNHILKTRDRVLKNNYKLASAEGDEDIEAKDQGFTRPKVLILLPTRNAAVQFINTLVAISGLKQCENKKRFTDAFKVDSEPMANKPEDFQNLFEGNTNDLFCLGVKFTRQAVKLYSSFYNSDLIVASPLGLRLIVGNEGDKKHDHDFLSSIELVIVDQADAMLMQSWDNVKHIFANLNLMPKESHGCDFSRIRSSYLDGKIKLLRQTVVLSAFPTPEIYNLQAKLCFNIGGKLRCRLDYKGSMASIGIRIRQVFTRLSVPTHAQDANERFNYFTTVVLPGLLRGSSYEGTLVYMPSYLDFVRVRNYMDKKDMSFVTLSEYTSQSQLSRGRSYFADGRSKIMLYSQRLHHFRRYNLRGVKTIVFYGLPDNPLFYQEICRFLGRTAIEQGIDPDMLKVVVLFSKWDTVKLERVVGSNRVGNLVEGTNDTHEFY